jgi:Tol biopolymer transport system component
MRMAAVLAALWLPAIVPAAEIKAEVALRAAMEQETVKGDLKGAIEQYRKILTAYQQDRSVAARALLHIAECYEKLGASEAQKAYERLLREYPEQKEAAAARARLAGRETGRRLDTDVTVQRVWSGEEVDLQGNLSPDGRHLAFADWRTGTGRLAVHDLQTGENRLVTMPKADCYAKEPMFSPDGKQIAYSCENNDESIRLVSVDGTNTREIAHMDYGVFLSSWSPDGKHIAAVHNDAKGDRTNQVILLSMSDGSKTRLKSTGWRWPSIGGFSPDGRFLVYSLPNDPSKNDGGIFVIAADGSRESLLTHDSVSDGNPIWTPDGRAIVFTSDRSGTKDLWYIRVVDGRPEGAPELLRAQAGGVEPKGFTRDGALYYGNHRLQTDAYSAEFRPDEMTTAPPVRLTERFIGSNHEPEPSPDGKFLAFLQRSPGDLSNGPATLVIRSVETGQERALAKTLRTYYLARSLHWYPDSRSVLLEDANNNRRRFQRINVETGEARTVFEGPYEVWTTAELSKDGKDLFYSIFDPSSEKDGKRLVRLIRRDIESGQETELYRQETSGIGFFGMTLSPDGKDLAFSANREDGRRLLIVPTRGGAVTEIFRGSSELPLPWGATWTKDGRFVIAPTGGMNRVQLQAFPIVGGEPRPLGVSMTGISSPSVTPDGRHILFTGARRSQELWVMRNILPQLQTSR